MPARFADRWRFAQRSAACTAAVVDRDGRGRNDRSSALAGIRARKRSQQADGRTDESDAVMLFLEATSQALRQGRGPRGIAVHAQGVRPRSAESSRPSRRRCARSRAESARATTMAGSCRTASGPGPRRQRSVGAIRPIGEGLRHDAESGGPCGGEELGPRGTKDEQRGIEGGDGADDRPRQIRDRARPCCTGRRAASHAAGVHPRPRRRRRPPQPDRGRSPRLRTGVTGSSRRPNPSRSGNPGWAPRATPRSLGEPDDLSQSGGIAGVTSGGDARRGDDAHQGDVALRHAAGCLPEIGVQVDSCDDRLTFNGTSSRLSAIGCSACRRQWHRALTESAGALYSGNRFTTSARTGSRRSRGENRPIDRPVDGERRIVSTRCRARWPDRRGRCTCTRPAPRR